MESGWRISEERTGFVRTVRNELTLRFEEGDAPGYIRRRMVRRIEEPIDLCQSFYGVR